MTLANLEIGKDAIIESVACSSESLRRHILDMGLTPGTEITVIKMAPMGDPIQIRVRGYELTLRKEDATCIALKDIHTAHENIKKYKDRIKVVAHPQKGEIGKYPLKKAVELYQIMKCYSLL
nr:FeoA family protein [Cellulosilyticum ruminicola]